jgi:membrane protein
MARVRFLGDWLYLAVKRFFDDGCPHSAAAISFYVLFSMFPLLIFAVGILSIFLRDTKLQTEVVDAITDALPLSAIEGRNDVSKAIRDVANANAGAISLFGLVTMAWSASSMFGAIRRSLNTAFRATRQGAPLVQKLKDLGLVLLFIPFILASLTATAVLRFLDQSRDAIPALGQIADLMGPAWPAISLAIPVWMSFTAISGLYWLVPVRRPRLRHVLPGAVAAALLFELVTVGFSVYVENFGRYDIIFGSLGALVAFLFWVYLSSNALLFGAEIVAQLPVAIERAESRINRPSEGKISIKRRLLLMLRGLILEPRQKEGGGERPRPGKDLR